MVATISQTAAAIRAHISATIRSSGSSTNRAEEIMPFATVWVTWDPIRKAPENSITEAIPRAVGSVIAFAPTEVANALATSLAPIP